MSLCNLTIQQLEANGAKLLGTCPVPGCGWPVARHRVENAVPHQGKVSFLHSLSFPCIVSIVLPYFSVLLWKHLLNPRFGTRR